METPKNLAGLTTERIMKLFSQFNEDAVVVLPVNQYNKVYTHVYTEVSKVVAFLEGIKD